LKQLGQYFDVEEGQKGKFRWGKSELSTRASMVWGGGYGGNGKKKTLRPNTCFHLRRKGNTNLGGKRFLGNKRRSPKSYGRAKRNWERGLLWGTKKNGGLIKGGFLGVH